MLIEIKEEVKQISDAEAAAEIFRSILLAANEVDQDKEHFWVMGLNNQNVILYVELISLGTLNNSLICPRETFRMAIIKAAAQIIVGHNHPSGSLEISSEDKEITCRLRQAGEILGIKLCDHIVIGNNKPGCFSFHRKGLLEENSKDPFNQNKFKKGEVETEKVAGSDQNAKDENILEQIERQNNDIICDVFDLKALAELSIHAAISPNESKKIDWVSVINLFNRSLDSIEEKSTKMDGLIFDNRNKA